MSARRGGVLMAALLGFFVGACGPVIRGPGSGEGDEGMGDVPPDTPPASSCDAATGGWEAYPFAAASALFNACAGGERLVTYSQAYGKWIGAELCDPARYKLFMAEARDGLFYEIADKGGHGQDHCELVSPSFTIFNDDDIQSGNCLDCEIGDSFASPIAGEGYARSAFGDPFTFESPVSELAYTPDWYACGVALKTCAERP